MTVDEKVKCFWQKEKEKAQKKLDAARTRTTVKKWWQRVKECETNQR